MNSKKKHEVVKYTITWPCINITNRKACLLEKLFCDIISRVLSESRGLQQILALKELQKHVKQHSFTDTFDSNVMDALSEIYFATPSKFALKKHFNSLYKVLFCTNETFVLSSLQRQMQKLLKLRTSDPPPNAATLIIDATSCLLNNMPFGQQVFSKNYYDVFGCIHEYLKSLLILLQEEKCISDKALLYSECQSALKAFTLLLQNFERLWDPCEFFPDEGLTKECPASSIIELLKDEHVPVNCGINLGIAFVMLLRMDKNVSVALYCTKLCENNTWTSLSDFSPLAQAYIFNGILAVISNSEFLRNGVIDDLFFTILTELISIAEKSKNPDIILFSAKAVSVWTSRSLDIVSSTIGSEILDGEFGKLGMSAAIVIQYILRYQDHSIDGLKYVIQQILSNVIKLHLKSSIVSVINGYKMRWLCMELLAMPAHSRGKYSLLSCLTEYMGATEMLDISRTLPKDLYEALNEASLATHVSEFLESLYKRSLDEMTAAVFEETWLHPLCHCLQNGSKEQIIAILQYILPVLLQINPVAPDYLIPQLLKPNFLQTGGCFAALLACGKFMLDKTSRKKGKETFLPIPLDLYKKALCHAEDQVRLSALSVLCDYHKSTEVFLPSEFELAKYAIPWNICSQCPAFRQQFVAFIKKFLMRLKDSYYALSRKSKDSSAAQLQKQEYEEFLVWLVEYLASCLHPGANFPRRVTCVSLLSLLHTLFPHSTDVASGHMHLPLKNMPLAYSLLEMLKDTYENNKQSVLHMLTSSSNSFLELMDDPEVLANLFSDTIALLFSTKPPDSVTASYMFAFLVKFNETAHICEAFLKKTMTSDISLHQYQLHKELLLIEVLQKVLMSQFQVAKENLLTAAAEGPLYGVLMCIRRLIMDIDFNLVNKMDSVRKWQEQIEELIRLCLDVAEVVESVVCNASPEGHLPMDTDTESIEQLQNVVRSALGCRFQDAVVIEEEELGLDLTKSHAVTAQMLLLCSWRTHKEVSLLFGELAAKLPIMVHGDSSGILTPEQLIDIGRYFTTQLSKVKHRGAFEQAYVGFRELCHRLQRSQVFMLQELPKKWLQELFDFIEGRSDNIILCSSRRSAGLPYMMQALLITEPDIMGSHSFKSVMNNLLQLASPSQLSSDSQVHALNILRALYRDSCLGECVMPFVSDGLKVAILGFKALNWAVRNSSTLLFSALITRIFGVNRSRDEPQRKNCLTGRAFFSRFPSSYKFLLTELELSIKKLVSNTDPSISLEPSLYPVLLVLGRLYPSPLDASDCSMKLSVFIPLVLECANSPVYKIRVLAARALFPLLYSRKLLNILEVLFSSLADAFNKSYYNRTHGILLQILQIMKELHSGQFTRIQINESENLSELIVCCKFLGLRKNPCYITKGAFIEVLHYYILLSAGKDHDGLDDILQHVVDECKDASRALGKEAYLTRGVHLLFSYFLQQSDNASPFKDRTAQLEFCEQMILNLLSSTFPEVHLTMLKILVHKLKNKGEHIPSEASDCVGSFVKDLNTNKNILLECISNITEKIIQLVAHNTCHHSCLDMLYLLMCKLPKAFKEPWHRTLGHKSLIQTLAFVLEKLKLENRESTANAMLLFSRHVASELYENLHAVQESGDEVSRNESISILDTWCCKLETYAHPDCGIDTRHSVLQVLDGVKCSLLCEKFNVLGKLVIPLWNTLLLLLTDDEPDIKNKAGKIIMTLKAYRNQGESSLLEVSMVPSLALDCLIGLFVDQFGDSYPDDCISTLLRWIFRSSTFEDSFQTDEQPFDKGEMNVFSEDFTLMSLSAKHLSTLLVTNVKITSREIKCEHIFSTKDSPCGITELVGHCISEMHKVMLTNNYSPFQNCHLEKHLLYISQRAYAISCFTPHITIPSSHAQEIKTCLEIIKNIPCKSSFLCHIEYILQKCVK